MKHRYTLSILTVFCAACAFAAAPMLIPAPREMTMTGGEVLAASAAPKTEVVKSIPPEGYELSITTNGVSIRHSDDGRRGPFLCEDDACAAAGGRDGCDHTVP